MIQRMLSGINKKAPMRSLFAFWLCVFCAPNVYASGAGIATAHPLATQAGMRVLQEGGNAFDAAVTVSAVLAVVEPYSRIALVLVAEASG